MSTSAFTYCTKCKRLLIWGQVCACGEPSNEEAS